MRTALHCLSMPARCLAVLALATLVPASEAGDWNADAVDTAGIYHPSSAEVWLTDLHQGEPDYVFQYGPAGAGWRSIAGDWNGDGVDTVGLYDPGTAIFYLRNAHAAGWADLAFAYGPADSGWIPLAGDWDGDGFDTVGLYDPTASIFHLANTHAPGAADLIFPYGPPSLGWLPIAGDWDGDGVDTVGLYDPSSAVFHLRNRHAGGAADVAFLYGPANALWLPLAGDWDGNRVDTVGLYDPAESAFHLRNSNTSGPADVAFVFGRPDLGPVPIGSPPTGPHPGAEQQTLLALVNAARAQGHDCGSEGFFGPAPALTWNGLLADAAERHSRDMAQRDFFSHTGSDGSDVAIRVTEAGYDWWTVGENIAAGFDNPASVNAALLDSPGHCSNIMNPSFTELGSARADNPDAFYRFYWTEVFAAPW